MPEIMLIDHDAEHLQQAQKALEMRGARVLTFADGNEALSTLRSSRPDLIVLCVELGRLSGYSICNKLKKDPLLSVVPLILTSAHASAETFEQHRRLKTHAEAYLTKPYSLEALCRAASSFVDLGAAPQPLTDEVTFGGSQSGATLSDVGAARLEAALAEVEPTETAAPFLLEPTQTQATAPPEAAVAAAAAAPPVADTAAVNEAPAPAAGASEATVATPATPLPALGVEASQAAEALERARAELRQQAEQIDSLRQQLQQASAGLAARPPLPPPDVDAAAMQALRAGNARAKKAVDVAALLIEELSVASGP